MSDLEDILAYCEVATAGPWEWHDGRLFVAPVTYLFPGHPSAVDANKTPVVLGTISSYTIDGHGSDDGAKVSSTTSCLKADATFIARARTDLPRVTTDLIAARERIADLEESRDLWRDSAKTVGRELERARKVSEVTRRLVGHVQVGNRDAAWIAAREADELLAECDRVKGDEG